MTDCKVCGKSFEDEQELKDHNVWDHASFTEMYGEEERKKVGISPLTGKDVYKDVDDADEIDQQEDKPTQSHDDWKKDLDSMRDQYSTEDVTDCAICNSTEHPTSEHPVTETDEEDQRDMANDLNKPYDLVPKIPEPWEYGGADYKREGDPDGDKAEEEGGADDPLKKVDSLSESYRFMSRDKRASLFESLKFEQGDSAILAGLEWNELTRPIKVEASEAYAKELTEEEEKLEKYSRVNEEDEEEDKAYESLYNLEKYHTSPDFKKKSLICSKCNESFYNFNDRSVHFNEVHATGQEYELPDQCPFCKEIIQEPDTLDWHMQEKHGAHVPSQFTQTGVSAGMADTDFDSLESYKRATEGQGGTYGRSSFMLNPQHEDITTCVVCGRDIDSHSNPNTDYRGMRGDAPPTDHYFLGGDQGGSDDKYDFESHKATEAFDTDWACPRCGNKNVKTKYDEDGLPAGRECPKCGLGKESYAKEESIYGSVIDDHFDEQYVMDQDGMYKCKHCGAWLDVHNIAGFTPEEVAKHHLETEHGITESHAKEAKIPSGDLYQYGSKVGTIRDYNPKQHEGYVTLDGIGIEEFGAMTSDFEVRVNGERVPNKWDGKHDYNLDLFGESRATPGFDTNCTDGEPHEPADRNSWETTCTKCGKKVEQTSEGSGYWFNYPEDQINWDKAINNLDEFGNVIRESYAKESSSASDLRQEIRKQKEFINMASFENPLNMGDAEDKLHNLESELESLGGEELESTEDAGTTMRRQKDILDKTEDYDPTLELKHGYPWQEGQEGEGGHQDLDDTTEYPDDPEEDDKKKKKKSTEAEYVDDSDNVEDKYVCPDCDEEFNSDEQLQGHQYSYYHGKYKDEGEGEDMPRNEMGGY